MSRRGGRGDGVDIIAGVAVECKISDLTGQDLDVYDPVQGSVRNAEFIHPGWQVADDHVFIIVSIAVHYRRTIGLSRIIFFCIEGF